MKKITLLTIFICLIFSANTFGQTTWYVKAGGTGSGLFPGDEMGTVNNAVVASLSGDIINIDGTINQTGQVTIPHNLTFQGQNNCIINGTDNFSGGTSSRLYIIATDGISATFNNISFKGSKNKPSSGAVLSMNTDGTVTFTNCIFDNNSTTGANQGGAVFCSKGILTITNSAFKNNTSGQSGGAIYVNSTLASTTTITKTTFYNNLAEGILGSDGGGAILIEGTPSLLGFMSITNCTFFQNKTVKAGLDYGAIRCTNANVAVLNSLFYGNTIDSGNSGTTVSDFGSAPGGVQSFRYSQAQWITNNIDTRENFISFVKANSAPNGVAVNLAGSNLNFNTTTNVVQYGLPGSGEDSPIDYGNDGNDVGAWNSGFTLSAADNTFLTKNFKIFENRNTNTLNLINSTNQKINIEIYNLLGSKLLSVKNLGEETQIKNTFQAGVYVLVGTSDNGSFSKKFIVQN